MGVQFIMYIGIMWKLLFGPYKWKITLSMNLLGTGVTLAPSGLSKFDKAYKQERDTNFLRNGRISTKLVPKLTS